MQRLYTRDDYMRRIEWMKKARRNIAITTDIIVGFPGETEAEFEQTLSLLDEVEYDSLFSFKYSPRPNTPALALEDHIPEEEKTRRLAILQERATGHSDPAEFGTGRHRRRGLRGRLQSGHGSMDRTDHPKSDAELRSSGVSEPRDGATLAGSIWNVRVTRAGPNLVGR